MYLSLSLVGFLFGVVWSRCFCSADAALADPTPVQVLQPGGGPSIDLILRGGPETHHITDTKGYTVVTDDRSALVYATKHQKTNALVPSALLVGGSDPAQHDIPKYLASTEPTARRRLPSGCEELSSRVLTTTPTMANLVVLIRFADHRHRNLPSVDDIDILFNKAGGDPVIAPSGSVRDVFDYNSYGKFALDSVIIGWVDLPETEAYYAGGVSGFHSVRFVEAFSYALDHLESQLNVDFDAFDADQDSFVDIITLIHSGYAAEVGGVDQDGANTEDRIWSHRRRLNSSQHWMSASGVRAHQYATSPALWDRFGSKIGRVGVITHELGHGLIPSSLPDMYGTIAGNGVGSYDLMSNHWGFGPHELRQLYPPVMSSWTKMMLAWVEPIMIQSSGTFILRASALFDTVYRIDLNDAGSEYLLIENRQPIGFDTFLPYGGLAIWHIDELASDVEGFPAQPGPWPQNGNHYKVALLQADGRYDLEQGVNFGDSTDLFHASGVDELGPWGTSTETFPNTNTYQSGDVRETGIRIFDISESDQTMSFSVDFLLDRSQPIQILQTLFFDNNGAAGNMFDVFPKTDVTVHKLDLHIEQPGQTLIEIFVKSGTHVAYEQDPSAWNRLEPIAVDIEGTGPGILITVDVGPVELSAGTLYAFYITLLTGKLRYTNGVGVGTIVASDDHMIIYDGVGKAGFFGSTFPNRIWNGAMHYSLNATTPSSNPSFGPERGLRELTTTYVGGSGQAGNMFDVVAYQDVMIIGFDLHLNEQRDVGVEILTKIGSFRDSRRSCDDWSFLSYQTVMSSGNGRPSHVTLSADNAVFIQRDHIQAFYVTVTDGSGMRYTPGAGTNTVVAYDESVAIMEGIGVGYRCGVTFWDRIWNGAIYYEPVES